MEIRAHSALPRGLADGSSAAAMYTTVSPLQQLGDSGGGAGGKPCAAFLSQLYRPAMCQHCFRSIAQHGSGEGWVEETEAVTKRVFFRNVQTNERLFARPADSEITSIVARLRDASSGEKKKNAWGELEGGGLVGAQVELWQQRVSAPGAGASSGGGGGSPSEARASPPRAEQGGAAGLAIRQAADVVVNVSNKASNKALA